MNKADTNTTKETEQDTIDAVIADSASANPPAGEQTKKTGQSHGGRNFVLVLLLIVVAVLAALSMSGQLTLLYESLTARFNNTTEQRHQPPKKIIPVPAKSASKTIVSTTTAKAVSAVKPRPAIVHQSVVPSEDVRELLSSIEALHNQLVQMENSQRSMQNGLKEQQQMNLQVRLRWIADPASRLPQLQLTWEEISLLPGLSDSERQEAATMHVLARNQIQQLKQWQSALKKWVDALSTPLHQNILPKPEYPWLAWVVKQFQLRHAPSLEARRLNNMRTRLLDVSRQLTLESWPEKGEWQSLQAELLLQIKAMQHTNVNDSRAVETGLPENFDAIQSDIHTLRETALKWSRHRSGAWQQGGEQ